MSKHMYLTREELSIIGSCRQTSPIAIAVHRILSDLDALRAELKAAQEENGRMRKALEQYGVYLESGHDADLNRFFLMRERALSPQPAQPDKP